MLRARRYRGRRSWLAVLVLGGVLALLSALLPVRAVWSVASLSDPVKLATLGEREANPRLNKLVYWLDQARSRGWAVERTYAWASVLNGTTEPRFSLVRESFQRNLKIADELGLLTPANRERLRLGRAALVTAGPYLGEPAEVDHIVPFSLAPEVGNELANLELMPRGLNRSKSNRVGRRQLHHAGRLAEAGLLRAESLARVQAQAGGAR